MKVFKTQLAAFWACFCLILLASDIQSILLEETDEEIENAIIQLPTINTKNGSFSNLDLRWQFKKGRNPFRRKK